MKAERAYIALAEAMDQSKVIPPCQISDPELWFADIGETQASMQAKKLCQTCPVIQECLAYAMISKERFGVWGGKTARERQIMRVELGAHSGKFKKA